MKKLFALSLMALLLALFAPPAIHAQDEDPANHVLLAQLTTADTAVAEAGVITPAVTEVNNGDKLEQAGQTGLQIAEGLGIAVDTNADAATILNQVLSNIQQHPVKGTGVKQIILYVLSILGTVGTIFFFVLHQIQKKKNKT